MFLITLGVVVAFSYFVAISVADPWLPLFLGVVANVILISECRRVARFRKDGVRYFVAFLEFD